MDSSKNEPAESSTTWLGVISRFIDHLFSLFKADKAFPGIMFGMIVLLSIFLLKYPSEKLPELVKFTGSFLTSEKYWFFPTIALILFLIWVIIKIDLKSKKEVKKVCIQRKNIIHGIDNGELKQIHVHNSSEMDTKVQINSIL